MIDRSYWYGKEVEGRYTGIYTLFIRSEFPPEMDFNEIPHLIPHVFFTSEAIANFSYFEGMARHLVFTGNKAVTLECKPEDVCKIPKDLFNACHVLMRVSLPEIAKLKEMDSISLDVEPYRCYLASKNVFQKVEPEAYSNDKPCA